MPEWKNQPVQASMSSLSFNVCANQSVDKSVLLSQAMPVFERTIKQAVECERRMLVLEFKRLLDATEQDLFTADQVERLIDQVVADRDSGK